LKLVKKQTIESVAKILNLRKVKIVHVFTIKK